MAVCKLNNGEIVILMYPNDVTDLIREKLGNEVGNFIDEYINKNVDEIADLEEQLKEANLNWEMLEESSRTFILDLKDEIEYIQNMLFEKRINKKKIISTITNLIKTIHNYF